MPSLRCVVSALLVAAVWVCHGQASRPLPPEVARLVPLLSDANVEVRIKAVNDLTDIPKLEAWHEIFQSYAQQPESVRSEIARVLTWFCRDFLKLVGGSPEYVEYRTQVVQLTNEIDDILRRFDGSPSKEEVDRLRAQIKVLGEKHHGFGHEKPMNVSRVAVKEMLGVFAAALTDPSPRLQDQAYATLGCLADISFRPQKPGYRWICGNRAEMSEYRDLISAAVSDVVRQQAIKKPQLLMKLVAGKVTGYLDIAVALAETHNSLIRPYIMTFLRSEDEEVADAGLLCVNAWPIPEALPKLISEIKYPVSGALWGYEHHDVALLSYGPAMSLAMLGSWFKSSKDQKVASLRLAAETPCQAALRLIARGLRDRDSEVRVEAVDAAASIREAEWDEDWFGRNPADLTDNDRQQILRALYELTSDRDPEVRAAALKHVNDDSGGS